MATIQEATQNAVAFAQASLGPERTKAMQLEEIESGVEGGTDVWRITLSLPDAYPTNPLEAIGIRRQYKTFTVAKNTGDVLSMKIRELWGKA
jgi:hypothetical protein